MLLFTPKLYIFIKTNSHNTKPSFEDKPRHYICVQVSFSSGWYYWLLKMLKQFFVKTVLWFEFGVF